MIRKTVLFLAVCSFALAMPTLASAQGKASTLDTAKAKAFVGDWVLTVEGRRGPQERPLAITDVGRQGGRGIGRRPRRPRHHHRHHHGGRRPRPEVEPDQPSKARSPS